MICFIIFLTINFCASEWIELVPIHNAKNVSGITIYQTTPSSYEVMMKTPLSRTTPIYETYQESSLIDRNFNVDDVYYNQTISPIEYDDDIVDNVPNNGFLSFLQLIQQNLLKSASRESKMTVLTNLRDKLLSNLYTRISKLWKRKSEENKNEARGYKDDYEHSHGMDFPSNEGALMTIGFLTFAVFLIKLVIKLVQALKYKYAYYATTTTTTVATLILLKRKKREEFNEETAKVLSYIEKLPY